MIQLSIEESKIEQFFNNSKEEVMHTLKFIAENNLNGFLRNKDEYELTKMENEIVQKVVVEKFPYIIMYEQYYDIGDI